MADTPRERRAARASKRRPMDPKVFRKLIVPLVIIALLGFVVGMVVYRELNRADCPGHWHASFAVFVDGERVTFEQPPYALSGDTPEGKLPLSMHMHTNRDGSSTAQSQGILHYEPTDKPTCRGVESSFRLLDVDLRESSMTIEGDGHNVEGTFRNNGTNQLRAWTANYNATGGLEWKEVPWGDFVDMGQLPDQTRVLIVSGNPAEDEIRRMQDQVPVPVN